MVKLLHTRSYTRFSMHTIAPSQQFWLSADDERVYPKKLTKVKGQKKNWRKKISHAQGIEMPKMV